MNKLKADIAAAGLSDRIRFTGELPIEQVPAWYQRISIYVFASRVEGFGLTMLEAMAAGNAVVATRAGAAELVIEDGVTGVLAPTGDIEALTASIEPLMRAPERCEVDRRAGAGAGDGRLQPQSRGRRDHRRLSENLGRAGSRLILVTPLA